MNAIKPSHGIGNNTDNGPRYHGPDKGRSIASGNAGFKSHLEAVLAQGGNGYRLNRVELPIELRTPTRRVVFVSDRGSVLNPSTVCAAYSSSSAEEQKPNHILYG